MQRRLIQYSLPVWGAVAALSLPASAAYGDDAVIPSQFSVGELLSAPQTNGAADLRFRELVAQPTVTAEPSQVPSVTQEPIAPPSSSDTPEDPVAPVDPGESAEPSPDPSTPADPSPKSPEPEVPDPETPAPSEPEQPSPEPESPEPTPTPEQPDPSPESPIIGGAASVDDSGGDNQVPPADDESAEAQPDGESDTVQPSNREPGVVDGSDNTPSLEVPGRAQNSTSDSQRSQGATGKLEDTFAGRGENRQSSSSDFSSALLGEIDSTERQLSSGEIFGVHFENPVEGIEGRVRADEPTDAAMSNLLRIPGAEDWVGDYLQHSTKNKDKVAAAGNNLGVSGADGANAQAGTVESSGTITRGVSVIPGAGPLLLFTGIAVTIISVIVRRFAQTNNGN
ncbi:hypothetical protein [Rothia sp. ZJ932]|uniref:hypothetical protein n=1 Tax=Rothia sp. ZJ932 TaxID=2810516 RepID=UPI001966F82F|nr:hypothetical protein [Rothia sp. ZJ932]QRZ62329.1 hypothetical protein JR346_04345 [Rothia sp. ZJ932]